MPAKGLGALRGFENGHRQSNRDRRTKKEERQRRRIPERVQLARHDQIQGAERTLVQRGEKYSCHHQNWHDGFDVLHWSLQVESLQNVWQEFEKQHGCISHHAHPYFKHHGVRIHVDELVPDEPRPAKIKQQANDEKRVAEKSRQNHGPHDAVQAFDVEEIDRTGNAEPAGCEHDAAKTIEANPEPPGKLVAHVGHGAEPPEITNISRVSAEEHDGDKQNSPESYFDFHATPPCLSMDSASATSSLRCASQYTPPRTRAQRGMKSGTLDMTRPVNSGNALSPILAMGG